MKERRENLGGSFVPEVFLGFLRDFHITSDVCVVFSSMFFSSPLYYFLGIRALVYIFFCCCYVGLIFLFGIVKVKVFSHGCPVWVALCGALWWGMVSVVVDFFFVGVILACWMLSTMSSLLLVGHRDSWLLLQAATIVGNRWHSLVLMATIFDLLGEPLSTERHLFFKW